MTFVLIQFIELVIYVIYRHSQFLGAKLDYMYDDEELRFAKRKKNTDYKLLGSGVIQNLDAILYYLFRVDEISVSTKGSVYRQKCRYGYSGVVSSVSLCSFDYSL